MNIKQNKTIKLILGFAMLFICLIFLFCEVYRVRLIIVDVKSGHIYAQLKPLGTSFLFDIISTTNKNICIKTHYKYCDGKIYALSTGYSNVNKEDVESIILVEGDYLEGGPRTSYTANDSVTVVHTDMVFDELSILVEETCTIFYQAPDYFDDGFDYKEIDISEFCEPESELLIVIGRGIVKGL